MKESCKERKEFSEIYFIYYVLLYQNNFIYSFDPKPIQIDTLLKPYSFLTECPNNKWGLNCNNTCSSTFCASCDKVKGCICEVGKKGVNCSEDIDECESANSCDNTSVCVNTDGSYFCQCKTGYKKNSNINTCEGKRIQSGFHRFS